MSRWILVWCLCLGLLAQEEMPGPEPVDTTLLAAAEAIMGVSFSHEERVMMAEGVAQNLENYLAVRKVDLPNGVAPILVFQPFPDGRIPELAKDAPRFELPEVGELPEDDETIAFLPITQLAGFIKSGKLTSERLTRIYLDRLKRFGPVLECVTSLLEERALTKARAMDEELKAGHYRGPLHGIPYGAKDLLAVEGTVTTWGAAPYRDQRIEETATVIEKLDEAGAVLVAKLTLGALAMGDVWYGGKTRNPWNLEQGSSGSSAGSASATSAGLVGFSIGSETWGSIVSPATRCGVTGLRPSFGRVSRHGAMALSWSMDKLGPICRSVRDTALVFDVIRGWDGRDVSALDAPFPYSSDSRLADIKVGYLKKAFEADYPGKEQDQASLEVLRKLGMELIPIETPDLPVGSLTTILSAEAAAAFDELTRSGKDDLLVSQNENAWPNFFRTARMIPAVEYIQANRVRQLLVQAMALEMEKVDVYVMPSFSNHLLLTNLTGHPCVVVPNGFSKPNAPKSISFIGRLFGEARLLRVAESYQEATSFHLQHPSAYKGGKKSE